MNLITEKEISHLIEEFLNARLNDPTRLPKEERLLEKIMETGNEEEIRKQNEKIVELKARFSKEEWIHDAAMRRVHWQSIGTHISKGIHPDSRGNSVVFNKSNKKKNGFAGSDDLNELNLDSTGNAAALDIFNLFNLSVGDTTILTMIKNRHPEMINALSQDKKKAQEYLEHFRNAVVGEIINPITHELNKQILWPLEREKSIQNDHYRILVPLYPSSLTHHVYQKIQERYSDSNKEARDSRYKKMSEKKLYFTFNDLAVVKLGGSNPQGVGHLNSQQMGRNFLLPSLPPTFKPSKKTLPTQYQKTIFNRNLESYFVIRTGFDELFAVIKSVKNNKSIRDQRKAALNLILYGILQRVNYIQHELQQGWSWDYKLDRYEKRWLDPLYYQNNEAEENIVIDEWLGEIELSFANWVNGILRRQFKSIEYNINDAEALEWRREMREAIRENQRKGGNIYE